MRFAGWFSFLRHGASDKGLKADTRGDSHGPSLTEPPAAATALKRSDSATSDLEATFLRQPFIQQKTERQKQHTARKCLSLEASGHTSCVQVDKLQIAEQTGIQLRDLRLLDPHLATSYPSALKSRESALIMNLEFVKAVVTSNALLLFNPEDANAVRFVETLQQRLQGKASADDQGILRMDSPFELRALEVALELVCQYLASQATDLEAAAHPALDALTLKVSTGSLERVRRVKARLVRLKTRVAAMKELLAKLLDDDEDMKDLDLTAKRADLSARTTQTQQRPEPGVAPTMTPSQAVAAANAENEAENARACAAEASLDLVEQLLEGYFMQVSSTENRLATLYEYVDDTEDYIEIDQDSHRNQLIQLDIIATAGMCSISIITVLTGFFSMNLESRAHSLADFYIVTFVSVFLCICTYVTFLFYCWYKKVLFH